MSQPEVIYKTDDLIAHDIDDRPNSAVRRARGADALLRRPAGADVLLVAATSDARSSSNRVSGPFAALLRHRGYLASMRQANLRSCESI